MAARPRLPVLFFLVVLLVSTLNADELPRRGMIGLAVAASDSSRPEDPETNPLTITAVVPGSAGEAAGAQPGDIVRQVAGRKVVSSADFVAQIHSHIAGDRVLLAIARKGQPLTLTATLKPRPYETSPDADILYRSVVVEGARRRVIVTRPKTAGRYPAVLIMGGLGCYSLDGSLTPKAVPDDPYGPLLTALAKNNFVTMRVEKTGEGDSEGPACADLKATAELEAQGYIAGLRALKGYEFVDPAKVFVFAHSLGPLVGSLVLPREPVRGFIAAETIGRSWLEYMLENIRRQTAISGEPYDQVDDDVRTHEVCVHDFFALHRTSEEVIRISSQCAAMIGSFAGVPYTLMHQIGDISLARQWKPVNIPVLVIYGTSDPATSADEGRYLAELINSFHPGQASYVELAGMGHDFKLYESQREFMSRRSDSAKPHPYNEELSKVVLKWLADH
jgi:uncharacterized protein